MAVTMVEIAKRTNLSPATVSRVINGKGVGFISPATRQRVLDAAREMGYEPARLPADAPGRTMVVAAWIRNPDRSYYARIIRHLLEAAAPHGYDVIIAPVHDQVVGLAGGARLRDGPASAWPCDGVIAVDCPQAAEAYARRFPGGACPIVGLNAEFSELSDYVAIEAGGGVRQAIEHLLAVGCRRVAIVSSHKVHDKLRVARTAAYEEAVRAAGLTPEVILAPDASRHSARTAVTSYVQSHSAPDGMFCLSDDLAIGAYRGLRDMGVRVPEDTALLACDASEEMEFLDVPLSTIVQPLPEMCRSGWEVLMRRLRDSRAPLSQSLLKPELRLAASTRR